MANALDQSVSVVIPCYNGMPYLPSALDSAVMQTHRPAEIIVVDDGSKDDSGAAVEKHAAKYPDHHIKLIRQKNAGEPSARNAGILAATSMWVANLDTDDWWEPNKLALQLQAARSQPDCVMVHTGWVYHLPNGRTMHRDFDATSRRVGRCTRALLEPAAIAHPSIMVKREALRKIGGYDPTFKQACDIDLYFRLSAIGAFAFVPEVLLHYRIHAKQMSASQMDQIRFHHRAVRKFFEQHPDALREIGLDTAESALASHVALKLGSLYWKRRLGEFRQLLAFAQEHRLDNADIRQWRRRSRLPDWLILMKDKLTSSCAAASASAAKEEFA